MKIGILTFHCAHNYGAVLQCYALQEFLKSMGHEVQVIDYRPKYLTRSYKLFNIRKYFRKNIFLSFKIFYNDIKYIGKRKNRIRIFEDFISGMFNLSVRVKKNRIPDYYDLYIIGSDQIWNINITDNKIDDVFWGKFNKRNKRIISYAASMDINFITKKNQHIIRNLLDNFDYVSVRETELQDILKKINIKRVDLVLDPTLLLKSIFWDNIIEKPLVSQKYVLVYQFVSNKDVKSFADQIALEIGAQVIEINMDLINKVQHISLYDISPNLFLGYFKYASFILTSTYHGTAFSIVFNKPFYYINWGNTVNTRVDTLLSSVNLKDRIVDSNIENIKYRNIDFIDVNNRMIKLREKSISFLREACLK